MVLPDTHMTIHLRFPVVWKELELRRFQSLGPFISIDVQKFIAAELYKTVNIKHSPDIFSSESSNGEAKNKAGNCAVVSGRKQRAKR